MEDPEATCEACLRTCCRRDRLGPGCRACDASEDSDCARSTRLTEVAGAVFSTALTKERLSRALHVELFQKAPCWRPPAPPRAALHYPALPVSAPVPRLWRNVPVPVPRRRRWESHIPCRTVIRSWRASAAIVRVPIWPNRRAGAAAALPTPPGASAGHLLSLITWHSDTYLGRSDP